MATLQDAIDQIVTAVRGIAGIRHSPDEPTDVIAVYPAVQTFSKSGSYKHAPIGVMTGLHDVTVELHIARNDLPRDVAAAMVYAKSIPNAILKAHKAGTLTAVEEIGGIEYEFGPMTWAGTDTIGFRFTIHDVKTQDTIA